MDVMVLTYDIHLGICIHIVIYYMCIYIINILYLLSFVAPDPQETHR